MDDDNAPRFLDDWALATVEQELLLEVGVSSPRYLALVDPFSAGSHLPYLHPPKRGSTPHTCFTDASPSFLRVRRLMIGRLKWGGCFSVRNSEASGKNNGEMVI
jgi:hypothetical protein